MQDALFNFNIYRVFSMPSAYDSVVNINAIFLASHHILLYTLICAARLPLELIGISRSCVTKHGVSPEEAEHGRWH